MEHKLSYVKFQFISAKNNFKNELDNNRICAKNVNMNNVFTSLAEVIC